MTAEQGEGQPTGSGGVDIGAEVEQSGVGTDVDGTPDLPNKDQSASAGIEESNESRSGDQDSMKETSEKELDRSYIFIRRGTSFSDFAALNESNSIEARVARSRGRNVFLEDQPDDDELYHIEQSEGRIKTESGFVMHFVDDDALGLQGFDIVDTHQAYPVSIDTLETLPAAVLGRLREQDQIKITAKYDSEESRFVGVTTGWDRSRSQIDDLMEIADKMDGNIIGAAYYLAIRESEEWDRVDRIAGIRDIESRSVRQQINTIEEALNTRGPSVD